MAGIRADTLLAERGLTASRTAAAASIRAGRVRLGAHGPAISKPSQILPTDADLHVVESPPFVSRGGIKLENALSTLPVEVRVRECLDVGASSGGFTDCLLQRGAAHVIALDVGYGQLAWKLREDSRVTVLERTNARHLRPDRLPYAPELVVVDVSFIAVSKLLPSLVACMAARADLVALVKPQFELGRARVARGGVVRQPADRRDAISMVAEAASEVGLSVRGMAPSGLPGPKGNRETLLWCDREGPALTAEELADALLAVEPEVET